MSSPEQGSLFLLPEPYRSPKRKDPNVEKWAPHKGKPVTCDVCIMNRHHGTSDTDLNHARHTLTYGDRRWYLCSVHAGQVRNRERKLHG